MNKVFRGITGILMSMLLVIPAAASVAYAAEEAPGDTALRGSIEWEDDNNSKGFRPDEVTINLYENDALIGSTTTGEPAEWQFPFNVDVTADSETGELPAYRFEQSVPEKYAETAHADPVVEAGSIIIGSWDKYTPCNELLIPTSKPSDSIIVGKLTGKYADNPTVVVWTRESLNADDQEQISASVRNINGIGNPKSVEFYSGDNISIEEYGVAIHASSGKVMMNRPKCWALLSGAEYYRTYTQTNSGILRNRILPVGARPEQPEKPDVSEDPEQSEQPDSPEFSEHPDSQANDNSAKAEISPSDKTVSSAGVSSPGYPDTGDHNHVIMWIGLAALAVTAAAGLGRIAGKQ